MTQSGAKRMRNGRTDGLIGPDNQGMHLSGTPERLFLGFSCGSIRVPAGRRGLSHGPPGLHRLSQVSDPEPLPGAIHFVFSVYESNMHLPPIDVESNIDSSPGLLRVLHSPSIGGSNSANHFPFTKSNLHEVKTRLLMNGCLESDDVPTVLKLMQSYVN